MVMLIFYLAKISKLSDQLDEALFQKYLDELEERDLHSNSQDTVDCTDAL